MSETDVRYPDVAIYCNQPSVEDLMGSKVLDNPTVIIKVLSRSTSTVDQGTKLDEYQALASVQTIASVDPVNELCRTRERLVQGGWHDQMFSGERGIPIPTLGFTIPHEEIFARD